jgi:hypothetical protein
MKIFRIFLLSLLFVLQAAWASDSPPNILLIIADQHTGSVMTQRGYEHIKTPGIDRIADNGVTFNDDRHDAQQAR